MREIAGTGLDHGEKVHSSVRSYGDLGADAVAVGSSANGLHPQHVVLVAVVVSQQSRRAVVGGDQQIKIAVVIKISVGCAAAYDCSLQRGPDFGGYFLKLALAQISKKMRGLRVLDLRLHHADVVGDVAVYRENVGQAIEVVVEKESAEGQRLGGYPLQASSRGFVRKQA